MADIRMGVIGCGGRMGRMLVAEIAGGEGCVLSGGTAKTGSGYIGSDLGELAGIGRIGVAAGNAAGTSCGVENGWAMSDHLKREQASTGVAAIAVVAVNVHH